MGRRKPRVHCALFVPIGRRYRADDDQFHATPASWHEAVRTLSRSVNLSPATLLVLEAVARQLTYKTEGEGIPPGTEKEAIDANPEWAAIREDAFKKVEGLTVRITKEGVAADACVSVAQAKTSLKRLAGLGVIKAVSTIRHAPKKGDRGGTVWQVGSAADVLEIANKVVKLKPGRGSRLPPSQHETTEEKRGSGLPPSSGRGSGLPPQGGQDYPLKGSGTTPLRGSGLPPSRSPSTGNDSEIEFCLKGSKRDSESMVGKRLNIEGGSRGGTALPPSSSSRVSASHPGTVLDGILSVAILNARVIYRTLEPGDPSRAPLWFGTALPDDLTEVSAFLTNIRDGDYDPALWAAVSCWVADARELTSLTATLSSALYWLVRPIVTGFAAEQLWRVVSRPGQPGALEVAARVFPEGGGRAVRRGGVNDPTVSAAYCKSIGWLIGSIDRIDQYGAQDYWGARYANWTDYGEQLRRQSDRATLYPSVWDLIEKTRDPFADATARATEPLHRFLGIPDSVDLSRGVAAGFRPNAQHLANSVNQHRGSGPRLTGTFADVTSVDRFSYRAISGDYFRAEYHHRQETALIVTPANFPEFRRLFASERDLRDWWFRQALIRDPPTLDLYMKFGSNPEAVDQDGRWNGQEVAWRKTL